MAINLSNGLFGMGGMGGLSAPMPQQMASFYDPEQARKMKMKNAALYAGLAMLGQGPSDKPINFGTSLGQGLAAGFQQADAADKNYRDLAYQTFNINNQMEDRNYRREQDGINNAWMTKERGRKEQEWQQADAKKKQWDSYVAGLPPEQQAIAQMYPDKYAQQQAELMFNTGGGSNSLKEVENRKIIAEQNGLTPDSPAYQAYVLTGKMPREDQSPLTATDKKAILEADEAVASNMQAINILEGVLQKGPDGKSLNDKAGYGATAGMQSWVARNDPTGFFDDAQGTATTELDNRVIGQALSNLKSIFGGNPTEGERKILLDMQGASSKSPAEREAIYSAAIDAAKRRLAFNKQRADAMRGQTYYKPGGAPGQPMQNNGGWQIEEVP